MPNCSSRGLTGTTLVLGVIGDPIGHSLSPAMQNAALEALARDSIYVPFQVGPRQLREAIGGVRALGIRGINVTIPHKIEVMKYIDEIDPVAKLVGAINTISNIDGRLIGYNTDGIGFLRSLTEEAGRHPRGQLVTVLGAGGAARAIGFQLALSSPKCMVIANRNKNRAQALAGEIQVETGCKTIATGFDGLRAYLPATDILINTTPLGMYPNVASAPPVEEELLPSTALVCDIVYNPGETVFLRKAKEAGLATLPGLGMLAYQGAAALEIWLGVQAPVTAMKTALIKQLGIS
ncbi:MAG: shikimate dehydrogenase [Firmicutes bacterium]|nr:shikimate dehydrogenase [Bacillota bacterium]